MGTNYIAPIWRMPRNTNKDKLSNYSIDFNGSGDYIDCGSPSLFDDLTSFSFSCWFNSDIKSQDRGILGKWLSGTNRSFALNLETSGNIRFIVRSGGAAAQSYINTSDWSTGNWYNVIGTYDGSNVKLYLDGVLKDTVALTGTVDNVTQSFRIGVYGSASYFDGKISQVCFFDYELDSDQRTYLYNLNNPMAITGGEPIAYWPLGDNSNPNAPGSFPNISVGSDSVFDFNTSGAWIDCGNNPVFNVGTGDLSISAWVYPTSVSGNDDVCGIGTNGGTRFRLQRRANRIGAYIDSAAGQSSMDGSTALSINQWYHFVLVKAGANFNLYLNGSEVSEASYSNAGSFTDTEVAIGQYFGGTGNKWAGELTNIQIWTSALTTVGTNSDLKTLYNNGQPLMTGTQPQEANLKAWYKLNQTANWEADTVGNWQIPNAVSSYPQSFNFDGSDYINTNFQIGTETAYSFSAWFKMASAPANYSTILADANSSGQSRSQRAQLGFYRNFFFAVMGNGSSAWYDLSSYNISAAYDNNWHNITLVINGTSQKLYLDGSLVQTYTSSISAGTAGTQNYTIGRYGDYNGHYFEGELSNVQIWQAALSSTEVTTLYNNGTPLTTAIASDNLKGWYKLDNNEKFDGTNWSVENQKYPANWESALDFDGSGNHIDLGTISSFDDGDISFSLWCKLTTTGTFQYILSSTHTGSIAGINIAINSSGLVLFERAQDIANTQNNTGYAISGFTYGNWHHLCGTYNATSGELKAYVDGVLKSTTNDSADARSASTALKIGGLSTYATLYAAQGQISNIAIFNTTLDSSAVTALYNNGTPETSISSSPVSWWKLNNLTTGIQDSVGSNDGTNSGATKVNTFVSTEAGTSSGMTEQNLVNNNVSVFNGDSAGMTTANLVTSNISRTQPYSNYSFNFDSASSDYFDLGGLQGTALQPSNTTLVSDGFSVSVWVNLDDTSTFRTFWQNDGLGNANYYGLIFLMNTGGQLNIGYNNGGAAGSGSRKNYITTAAQITSTGTWYHIVAIYKGIAVTPGLYVNGVEITAFNSPTGSATTLVYSSSAKGSIGIGRNAIQPMEGKISNCACFDRTLTQDEVLNIYNNGVPQDLQTASSFSNNIAAWWPMDGSNSYYDGTNWVVRDLENGNDGTGVNTGNVDDLVGNAPGSDANGTGINLTIADLKGDMYDSNKNAYSINMADYADGVTNPANSGRSTDTP